MSIAPARTPSTLSAEQLTRYQKDGFITLHNSFQLTRSKHSTTKRTLSGGARICSIRTTCAVGGSIMSRPASVRLSASTRDRHWPGLQTVRARPRILAPLADIYGEPACLFKDKLIYKPPMTEGYNMHQDFIAWDGFPRSFITVLIAIDGAGNDNGATECFPGYHSSGSLVPEDGMYHDPPLDLIDLKQRRAARP